MKILLAAPEICTPWTEGRKRFVCDLSRALASQDEVRVITTVPPGEITEFPVSNKSMTSRSKSAHLFHLHRQLHVELNGFLPDLVCHFPYGTFRHVYRLANLWSMSHVDRLCRARGTTCFTIMYSISNETSLATLRPWVTNLVPVRLPPANEDNAIRFGIGLDDAQVTPRHIGNPARNRLLFMAGMWQRNRRRLEHVLDIRGLRLLLQAGRKLSSQDLSLTVAVPLLADESLCRSLRQHADNGWPEEKLHLVSAVNVPDVFLSHDLFIFPYMREETQFTPTSVIEAMATGVPVVLPMLDFLKELAGNGERAFTYRAGDASDLTDVIFHAIHDGPRHEVVRTQALDYVRQQMNIEHTCNDLRRRYRESVDDRGEIKTGTR